MIVEWATEAKLDREEIWTRIGRDDPQAAARLDDLFSRAVSTLIAHPQLGKAGSIRNTRELLPHPSYRLVYTTSGDRIQILTIVHTSRRWPLE